MSEQGPGQQIEDILRDTIAEAFNERGGVVIKWIALIEAFGTGGEDGVALWKFTSDGLHAWDTQGMLAHATTLMEAQIFGSVTGLLDDNGNGPWR